MSQFQFQTVGNIISGLGSIQELTKILQQHQFKKVLLVTDRGMVQHQIHLPILDILEAPKHLLLFFQTFKPIRLNRLC